MVAEGPIAQARLAWQAGDLARTDEICRVLLARDPMQGEAVFLRGLVAFKRGDVAGARTHLQHAAQLAPDVAAVQSSLGAVLEAGGDSVAALACFQRATQLDPGLAEAWLNLGLTALKAERFVEARRALERVVVLMPGVADAQVFLGLACDHLNDRDAALAAFERALALEPAHGEAHVNIVALHQVAGRLGDAARACARAIAQGHATAWIYEQMGLLRVDLGDPPGSRDAYRRALALEPANAKMHSNLLLSMLYDPAVTPREIRAAAADWNARHAASLAPIALAPRAPVGERPLRVGYLSRDFRQHPIAFFLAGVLANHDRNAVHATCYSDNARSDAWTQRLKASAHAWVDVAGLDDMGLARRIAADRIDILIELGGHTGANRLLVCARRPAPVQATWLGYPATTGLRAIDYFISDRHETPPGSEEDYVETLIRLPDGYLCYTAPDDAPDVGPLPARASGFVTFGCLNNPAKINEAALALWVEILAAVPRSRLLILAAAEGERDTLTRVQGSLKASGIDSARIELVTRRPHAQLLDVYNRIDVALDPIPYTGGLTTCEALWMGVPVVTLAGATFASRHSLTHLTNAGLPDFVTRERDAYVRRAIEAATDLDGLAALRAGLRARVAASKLGDAAGFTRNFEAALRGMAARKG